VGNVNTHTTEEREREHDVRVLLGGTANEVLIFGADRT
jgi:hypothetical protein